MKLSPSRRRRRVELRFTADNNPFPFPPKRVYLGERVPTRVIRRYAAAIAAEFHPDKIILFGSYAYGTPHKGSDVDLLVVMPARNQHDQAVQIQYQLTPPFPVDLIVRAPKQIAWRLAEGESFLTTIMSHGKVLYEKADASVGQEGRRGLRARRRPPLLNRYRPPRFLFFPLPAV